jgi:membrane-bound ClpP family serine protease
VHDWAHISGNILLSISMVDLILMLFFMCFETLESGVLVLVTLLAVTFSFLSIFGIVWLAVGTAWLVKAREEENCDASFITCCTWYVIISWTLVGTFLLVSAAMLWKDVHSERVSHVKKGYSGSGFSSDGSYGDITPNSPDSAQSDVSPRDD